MHIINEKNCNLCTGGNIALPIADESLIQGMKYSLAIGTLAALLARPFGLTGIVAFGSIGTIAGFGYGYYSYPTTS